MNPIQAELLARSAWSVRIVKRASIGVAVFALLACASEIPAPSWQLNAYGAAERGVQAYFEGRERTEESDFAQARLELARTGDPAQMARLELLRCAAQLASLVVQSCAGFAPLARDSTAAERAYAQYLEGASLTAGEIDLLPSAQRAPATAAPMQLANILSVQKDPLARLVAAGAVFARGDASPAIVQVAVDTASAQGWARPLLAWLGVQLRLAEAAGTKDDADRIRRRIYLIVQGAVR